MKIIVIPFILFLSIVFAEKNKDANRDANQQKIREQKQKVVACYKATSNNDITILEGFGLKQKMISKNKKLDVNFKFLNDDLSLEILENKKSIGKKTYPNAGLSFITPNIKLSEITKSLKGVECYFGSKAYFIHHNEKRDFVIHNHVQSRFYGYKKKFIKWYHKYANGFKNYPNFLLMDGPSWGDKYVIYEKQLAAITKPYRNADLLTGKLQEAQYKVAPSGNIHLSFNNEFKGDVYVMGTAYNYCTTNLFFSIGRALLSTNRDSLNIRLPGFYNHHQEIGLNKSLNMTYNTEFNDVKTLKKKNPKEFMRIFKEQKKVVETRLNGQIEVILKGEKGKTAKPKLILDVF